jgi:50S ribosomal subunit-associated GTPase HflX
MNKIDLAAPKQVERAPRPGPKERGLELHFISAKTGDGVAELMERIWSTVGAVKDEEEAGEGE